MESPQLLEISELRRDLERLQCENSNLRRENAAMFRLVGAVQALSRATAIGDIMTVVKHAAREIANADGASFVLKEGEFCFYADEDAVSPLWKGKKFPLDQCVSGWVMKNGKPAVIPDIYKDPRVPIEAYQPTYVKSLVLVPIRAESPIGAIGCYWACEHEPSAEELCIISALAETTSVAIQSADLFQALERRVRERTADLENANRELESFTHAASHDLRAPLRGVLQFAELLSLDKSQFLDDEAKQWLSKICASARRMDQLVESLLELSRSSHKKVEKQEINMSDLARETIEEFRSRDSRASWNIEDGLTAFADPVLARIVLQNLFSNAHKYSTKADKPMICFQRGKENGEFEVKDNGTGFNREKAKNLFEPFNRYHSSAQFDGSGLGLATVKRIVDSHGGKIEILSREGSGTTVLFAFQ